MQTLALPKPVFAVSSPSGFGTFSSAYLIRKKHSTVRQRPLMLSDAVSDCLKLWLENAPPKSTVFLGHGCFSNKG